MNIIIFIVVAVLGIAIGAYFGSRKNVNSLIALQAKEKAKNKEKVLKFFRKNEKVKNNDIESLLDVSDATATRYLDELEREGKVLQVGTTGHAVYYVLK